MLHASWFGGTSSSCSRATCQRSRPTDEKLGRPGWTKKQLREDCRCSFNAFTTLVDRLRGIFRRASSGIGKIRSGIKTEYTIWAAVPRIWNAKSLLSSAKRVCFETSASIAALSIIATEIVKKLRTESFGSCGLHDCKQYTKGFNTTCPGYSSNFWKSCDTLWTSTGCGWLWQYCSGWKEIYPTWLLIETFEKGISTTHVFLGILNFLSLFESNFTAFFLSVFWYTLVHISIGYVTV